MEFGERLKIALVTSGMSQKELADKMGMTQGAISRYFNGEREPDIANLIKLCNILHTSSDFLLGIDESYAKMSAESYSSAIKTIKKLKSVLDEYPV